MAKFKKRVFGENVSKGVILEFRNLASGQSGIFSGEEKAGMDEFGAMSANLMEEIFTGPGGILEPQEPTFENYLGDRTPFTRMWCAININTLAAIPPNGELVERHEEGFYFYVPKGKGDADRVMVGNDKDSRTRVFVVNENTEESYGNNSPLESLQVDGTESLQQITQLKHNPLMKPAAGITSVISKTQGALGALQNTTVEFVVHNKHDFENIFLPYFLKPGSIVCVDYGWSDMFNSLYNPIDQIKDKPLDMSEFDKFLYAENGFLARNYGKVNTVMGNVVSYDANITPEGSYECSLEIVSRNTSLLDKEITDDNKLKFIFANAINNILIEVLAAAARTQDVEQDVTGSVAETVDAEQPLSLPQIQELVGSLEQRDSSQIVNQFFNFLAGSSSQLSDISEVSSKTGIFHDNLRYKQYDKRGVGSFKSKTMGNHQEPTYISYGLFEDLFLTNFVAGTVPVEAPEDIDGNKKSVPFRKDPSKDFSNRFDSRTSYVRWDKDLADISKQTLEPNEPLSSFIIPDNWDDSYNSRTLGDEKILTDDSTGGKHPDYPGIAVMPLRDVFINVTMITEAFKKKSTVDDVILFILDVLNLESYKVWNLKISSDMNSRAVISVIDTNLHPEIKEEKEMLVFNVMGETSIVSQCDLKFTTPKAGLSSMIAIGNLNGPQRFEQLDLSALNNLNLLNRPEEKSNLPTIVKSLPLQGVTNKQMTKPAASLDFSNFIKTNNVEISPQVKKTITGGYISYRAQAKLKDAKKPPAKNPNAKEFKKRQSEANLVISDRSLLQEKLRTKYYDASGTDRVAPILPVELTLSVYGNNFLQIGDYYTINYLPSYYRNKVFFQILGIEDKIDVNGWTTTYNPSIMRVRPDQKELITGKVNPKDTLISPEARPLLNPAYKLMRGAETIRGVSNAVGYEAVLKSYSEGVDKYPVKYVNHPIRFDVYRHIIFPKKDWAPLVANPTDSADIAIACFHTSLGNGVNIKDSNNISFSCALRDVLLGRELTPFDAENIVIRKKGGLGEEGLMKKNKNKVVVNAFVDQEPILDRGGEMTQEQEGDYADALANISPSQISYYVIPDEDMFTDIKVEDYHLLDFGSPDDRSVNLPKFIEKYFFPISLELENEGQNLYELVVSGPTVHEKIYLPEHLLKGGENGTVESFMQNLRLRYDHYNNVLSEIDTANKLYESELQRNIELQEETGALDVIPFGG